MELEERSVVRPSPKVAGLRDVAAMAAVSIATVSNYLNHPNKVSGTTATRIQQAIDDLGYIGNAAARTIRTGVSRTIAILLSELDNPENNQVRASAEGRAEVAGYSMITANSAGSAERERRYLDLFESQRVAGILIAPLGDVDDRIRRLQERGIAVVSFGRPSNAGLCSSVSADDFAAGRLAVSHLLEQGRRRIAFVGGAHSAISERLEGARFAASLVGAKIEIIEATERSLAQGRLVAGKLASREASDRPDGVFAANDLLALGMLNAFLREGSIRVPEDIAIVGYDDIEFAQEAVVPLTSMRPSGALGRIGAELLLNEIERKRTTEHTHASFRPVLVPRETTVLPLG